MTTLEIKTRYCTGCGTKLEPFIAPAEKYGDYDKPNEDAYHKLTGEKQVRIAYKCPKSRWWPQKIRHEHYALGPVTNQEEAQKLFIK